MNAEEAETWRSKEIAVTDYRGKLQAARERKGLDIHEAAHLISGIIGNTSNYYDIEQHGRDLTSCYSLNEILDVCKLLNIHPRVLFCDEKSSAICVSDVVHKIKTYCAEKNLSVAQFEDLAGWRVESCLTNPAKALDEWNVDCLIDVCRELSVDWRSIITGL